MCPFYYIDGPLKGKVIYGDFKPKIAICAVDSERYLTTVQLLPRKQVVYHKYTYATKISHREHTYIVYVDIAAVEQPTKLTEEVIPYLTIDPHTQDHVPLYIKDYIFKNIKELKIIGNDGVLRPSSPSSAFASSCGFVDRGYTKE